MILDRHWWHTADKIRLVPDGDPDAAFLAFPAGAEVPDATCAKLGIVPKEGPAPVDPGAELGKLRARVAELEADKAEKAAPRPADKARAKSADKAGS